MIYTITFSPSIDYVISYNNKFNPNGLNRIETYNYFCGGKGINASVVLKRIGFDSKAITFLGGDTKTLFLQLLEKEKIDVLSFDTQTDTRINIKFFSKENSFEINGKKPEISTKQLKDLLTLVNQFNKHDLVFVMGVCDPNHLLDLISLLDKKGIEFVLDIDLQTNLEALSYKPFLIKPNLDELERMMNIKVKSENDIYHSMQKLLDLGVKNVMVSNGKHGNYLLTNKKDLYKVEISPISNIQSTTGAGDSLISSFVCLYKTSNDVIDSLKKATSLSIGTACSMWLGNKQDLVKYLDKINISKIF